MFYIGLSFVGEIPPRKEYSQMSIDQVLLHLSYEAVLSIMFNDNVVFEAEISVIEFFWYLINWVNQNTKDNEVTFIYKTIENDEPILSFTSLRSGCWEIDSIWMNSSTPLIIDHNVFWHAVDHLVNQLETTIN